MEPSSSSRCPDCGAVTFAAGDESSLSPSLCARCLGDYYLRALDLAPAPDPSPPAPALARGEALAEPHDPDPQGQAGKPARNWEMVAKIGEGGMGEVWEAVDPALGRTVAVKWLRAERQHEPESVARFLAEARIAGQLEHPGIVPVHEAGVDVHGRPFYSMRLVRGCTLAEIVEGLRSAAPEWVSAYPLGALLVVFQKICDAVAFAHSRGFVHRDLKPGNIMVGQFGEVVVMDWGLAKAIHGEDLPEEVDAATPELPRAPRAPSVPGLTVDDVVMGTLGFMAPEQASGRAAGSDERTDVFALGAILYTLLTLHPPVRGRDADLMLDRTRTGDIRPPISYNPSRRWMLSSDRRARLAHCPSGRVPGALSAVAMKALAVDPAARYQSVRDLQADIGAFQGGLVTRAQRAGPITRAGFWMWRHRGAMGLVTAIAALCALFVWKVSHTLSELRRTAPDFHALAESLLAQHRSEEALEKITYAIALEPENPDYWLLQGNLLQGLLRFSEARRAYQKALHLDPTREAARENLKLCQVFLARLRNGAEPTAADLSELYESLIEQGRSSEALALTPKVEGAQRRLLEFWEERLRAAGIQGTLKPRGPSSLDLDLSNSRVTSLAPLAGMPLRALNLSGCKEITDLSPLRGMPLVYLVMSATKVSSLTPLAELPLKDLQINGGEVRDLGPLRSITSLRQLTLINLQIHDLAPLTDLPLQGLTLSTLPVKSLEPLRGVPLTRLALTQVEVTDLGPLAGMPLEDLRLSRVPVTDLGPLRKLPLRTLHLHRCALITDITPLQESLFLERLTLPATLENIDFLRNLPRLKHLAHTSTLGSAEQFWRERDARNARSPATP